MNRDAIFGLLTAFILPFVAWGCFGTAPVNRGGEIRITRADGYTVTAIQSDNPKSAAVVTITGSDGKTKISTGGTYENTAGQFDQVLEAFRPYHWTAIACAVVGAIIIGTGYLPKRWGVTLLAAAGGLTVTAHFLPTFGTEIFWLTVAMAIAGAIYWFWGRHQFKTGELKYAI